MKLVFLDFSSSDPEISNRDEALGRILRDSSQKRLSGSESRLGGKFGFGFLQGGDDGWWGQEAVRLGRFGSTIRECCRRGKVRGWRWGGLIF